MSHDGHQAGDRRVEAARRRAMGGVAEVAASPTAQPRDRLGVAEHPLGLFDDARRGVGIQPLARREVAVRVDERLQGRPGA